MASGRAQADFQPMPLPQLRLSMEDQCRLRDRSTIMARQMYAGQGSDYADAQVSNFPVMHHCCLVNVLIKLELPVRGIASLAYLQCQVCCMHAVSSKKERGEGVVVFASLVFTCLLSSCVELQKNRHQSNA